MKTRQRRKSKQPKLDLYERVTEVILKKLEEGVAPWQSPSMAKVGWPRNFLTKNAYQGINVFLLASAGYASPWFLTYKQAQESGGQVRKGEKGLLIVKYGTFDVETEKESGDEQEKAQRGYLRGYTVFNASQIDGIEFPKIENPDYRPGEAMEEACRIVAEMPRPPKIEEGPHARPHYQPKTDIVGMPPRESFRSEEIYYLTLFHELTHSTGHESRLARRTLLENEGIEACGNARKTYAKEELVAEMGAAFLATHAGIIRDGFENSSAYLESWLKVLRVKENRRWIVEAASQAQKAVNYVVGR